MGLLDRKKNGTGGTAVQLREAGRHPFGMLESYVPLGSGEIALYRSIREAVPIVDAAILKLIRLTGGVRARCLDGRGQAGLSRFLKTVSVGRGQRGLQAFLDCYLDSMLTCGRADQVEIREGASPLEFTLCARGTGEALEPLPCQDLLLFTPFQPEAGSPYGVKSSRS